MKTKALLMGLLIAGVGFVSAAEPTLESLQADFGAEMQALGEKFRAAKTEAEKEAVYQQRPDPAKTVKAMMPLIEKEEDEAKAIDALVWVISQSRQGLPEGVLELVEKYKESKAVVGIILASQYDRSGKLKELAAWARENSKHPEVQGVAAFMNAQDRSLSDDEKLAELKFALANLGEVEFRGSKLKKRAEGMLFSLENLRIGQMAPEIEGEDQDGVPFKLSEYRGKVVVLDFWGDW